ncbi:YiiD C-terminal domain-containing protein [Prosthecobacter dejongeii]|uniref:Thioesterase domain-containing protein n=1 Tax=Prosthecobacter dejongeii TaxID=48465 RepID=A0A7W8DMV5_9BACT|nr:YiiD C-terminal domain-containing protein [Prosthecobacter dejongeii]MBB5035884.1 thioesterase domain-containing protein [Prosthecobacter dejongeii]
MNDDLLRETEHFLHEQIPLTRAMGVKVESYDGGTLVITAPLEPNHNHLGTAFGGSLSAIATLTGYSLLWLMLGDRTAHIVIRESTIRYRRPVRGLIRAFCQPPDGATIREFKKLFAEAGKARLNLQVTIQEEGQICVEFSGEFVAIK